MFVKSFLGYKRARPTRSKRRPTALKKVSQLRLFFHVVLIAVSIAVILMGYMSCVTLKKSFPTEDVLEKIAGDWKNTEYDMSKRPARRVIDQQGNVTVYDKTYDESGKKAGKITITKAWTETESWLWFKDEIHYNDSDTTVYELSKLDLQKMDWSLLWSEGDYPEKWDPVEYQSYFYRK